MPWWTVRGQMVDSKGFATETTIGQVSRAQYSGTARHDGGIGAANIEHCTRAEAEWPWPLVHRDFERSLCARRERSSERFQDARSSRGTSTNTRSPVTSIVRVWMALAAIHRSLE